MSCEINNIKDTTLQHFVSKYGEEGISKYLNLVAPIVEAFSVDTKINKSSASDLLADLRAYNARNGESHYYTVNGVKMTSKSIIEGTEEYLLPKLEISFGGKYLNQSYAYGKENVEDEEEFDEEEDGSPTEPGDDEVEYDPDDDYVSDDDSVDAFVDDEYDVDVEEEYDVEDMEDPFDYIEENILEDDFVLEEAFEDDIYDDAFTDLLFSDSPLNINLSLGINLVSTKVGNRLKRLRSLTDSLKGDILRIENDIKSIGPSPSNSAKIAELTAKLDQHKKNLVVLNTELKTLLRKKTVKNLGAMYDKSASWINSVLKSKNPSAAELKAVSDAIKMWQNLGAIFRRNMRLDKKTLDGILEIQRRAYNSDFDELYRKVIPSMIKSVGKDLFGVNVSESAMTAETDISTAGANALTIAHYSDKPLINLLHKFISSASFKSTNELFDAANNIKKMFHKLKAEGLDFRKMLSLDENGKWDKNLIARHKKEYYNFRNKIDQEFTENVNKIKYSRASNQEELILKEINKRAQKIRDNVYTINPELASTVDGKNKILAELIAITNDQVYSEKLINDAVKKYEDWKELYDNLVEREGELVESGKDAEESEIFLSEFKKNTSPQEYYDYTYEGQESIDDIRTFGDYKKYTIELPLRNDSNGKSLNVYDDRFDTNIRSNPAMMKFYNEYATEFAKYLSYLPGNAVRDIDGTFVPNVRKAMLDKMLDAGIKGVPATLKTKLLDAVTSRAGMQLQHLDADGNPKESIPLKYLEDIDVSQKSDDLEKNLMEFAGMAIAYKHLSAIEDYALLIKDTLDNMIENSVKADGTIDRVNSLKKIPSKNDLINLKKLVNHTLMNVLYNKATDKEGVSSKKSYDPNRKMASITDLIVMKEFNSLVKKYGIDSATTKIIKKYPTDVSIETEEVASKKVIKIIQDLEFSHDNGDITDESYEFKKSVYKQYTDGLGASFVWSQAADVAITWGAYKVFAYNPFPAVSNVGFGWVQILAHAAGRTDFTPKEAIAGIINASRSLKNTASGKGKAKNKLYNLAMRMGLLPEHYGGNAESTEYNISALNPMGLLSEGDYMLRVAALDAMMHHTKIEDLNGKQRPLIDAFNADGKWNAKEFGDNEDWGAHQESMTGNKELIAFTNKVKFVNELLHGNMAKETSTMLKRSALGRLVSQYRLSWLADSIYARFAPRKELGVLGRDFEGTYRTMWNFMEKEGVISGAGQLTKIFGKLLLFQGESSFNGIKISDKDRALFMSNIRKQLFEFKTLLVLYGAYLLVSASLDDDDKESRKWKYMMLNTLNKIIQDITFYINPKSFKTTTDNLIPALSLMGDYISFGNAMIEHMSGNPYYGDDKVKERFIRTFPMFNVYYKFKDRSEGEVQNKSR